MAIKNLFFFLPNVCMVFGDIPDFPDILGGLIILNNFIQLCWTSSALAQGTSCLRSTLVTIQRVQIIEPIQLKSLGLFLKRNILIPIFLVLSLFLIVVVDFLYVLIYSWLLSRFIYFLMTSDSLDPRHLCQIWFPIVM